MKFEKMRFIDTHLGPFICFVLASLFKIINSKKTLPGNYNICLGKYVGFGSILNAIPLMKQIKKNRNGIKLFFITFPSNTDICRMIPEIDEVYAIRNNNLFYMALDLIRFIPWSQKRKIGAFIDLEFLSYFSLIPLLLSFAKKRIGFYGLQKSRKLSLTDAVYFNSWRHVRETYLALSTPLGIEFDSKITKENIEIRIDSKDINQAGHIFNAFISAGKKLILINPNTGDLCLNRRWPGEYFINLAEKIAEKYQENYFIGFIGGKKDTEYTSSLFNRLSQKAKNISINLSGKFTISELAYILKEKTELLITNDSGPYHLAVVQKIKTIVFFGPETSKFYGPLGNEENTIIMELFLYCSPCLNVYTKKFTDCRNNRCLKEIKAETVFKKADLLLEKKKNV